MVSILLLALLIPLARADIIIDQESYAVGDLVHLKVVPALEDQTLVIITPTTTYRFIGGMPENAAFIAEHPGTHLVRIIDDNQLVDSAQFEVRDAAADAIDAIDRRVLPIATRLFVHATELRPGEPLIIDGPVVNVLAIGVVEDGREYRYIDSNRPIAYLPTGAGNIDIWLRYVNGTEERITVRVLAEGSPLAGISAVSPDDAASPAEPTSGQETIIDGSLTNGTATLAPEEFAPPTMIWKRDGAIIRQTTLDRFDPGVYDTDTYDLELRGSNTLRAVRFFGLRYATGTPIPLEEVPVGMLRGNIPGGTIAAIAIDPRNLTFGSAELSFVAEGIALYKCVEYDFAARTCLGEQRKVMDLVPGREYTISFDNQDPLYTQSGYLTNPSFESDTGGWTTLTESGTAPTYAWFSSDSPQSGMAEITLSGSTKTTLANYYQPFNLTLPAGTTIINISFSAKYRVSTYSAGAGNLYFWIQNATRTATLCQWNRSYAATVAWTDITLSAPANCSLSNFQANTNYTFRMRCNLNTASGGGQSEVCRWDEANVTVVYNDTQAPVLRAITDTPDPVQYGSSINFSVNVTDNIAVDKVFVEVQGTNHTMVLGPGNIYYYDQLNTAITPGIYSYRIYANDTNNNRVSNTSNALNFTVQDTQPPRVVVISPSEDSDTNNMTFLALFNVTDNVGVASCVLNVNSTVQNTTISPPQSTTLNLTGTLAADEFYSWNITCIDTSGNANTTAPRLIHRDTQAPIVMLNIPNNSIRVSPIAFNITASDPHLGSCTLYGNFSGSWGVNATNTTPGNGTPTAFPPIALADGSYRWNTLCSDNAGNGGFNSTNFTIRIDSAPPAYSGIAIAPSNNSAYALGAAHQFNISVTDAIAGVHTVLFEHNLSGTLVNASTTQAGNVYSYSAADIPAGDYRYRWFMNDTLDNRNQTMVLLYRVQRAAPLLNLTINGTYGNVTVNVGDSVNATGTVLVPSSGALELYMEGALVASGQTRIENISTLPTEQRYNFTLIYPATQNFTEGWLTLFVDVPDTTLPTVALGDPVNGSIQSGAVTFFFTPNDNIEIGNCTIILDGILNATADVAKGAERNISISGIPDGLRNWTVNCTDLSNNSFVNATRKYFTVDTVAPTAFDLYRPIAGNVSANLSPVFVWNQTSDTTFKNYTILVDNDINFASPNYQAALTPETNRSWQFTVVDQITWHWKVIAYDLAGNSRESDQVFNYSADATPPAITPTAPNDGGYMNRSAVNITYTVADFTDVVNCTLLINDAVNQTNTSIDKSGTNRFTVTFGDGIYYWNITCYDRAGGMGMSATRNITIDTVLPTVFTLFTPVNGSLSNNNTPLYTWDQTVETNFDRYTIEVSDNESFLSLNYTFDVQPITNTSYVQSSGIADGTWYWRVIAKDLAGNGRVIHPQFGVDTTPPTAFNLLTPANGTEQRVTLVTFTWEQANDPNFKNYTLIVSDSPVFAWVNYTNFTLSKTSTTASLLIDQDVKVYWRVIAYDDANNSRNSTDDFTYLADFADPVTTAVSPANNTVITANSAVPFQFNVTDLGTIMNCSLYLNATYNSLLNMPQKNITQTLTANLANGNWSWYVSCTDKAGNIGNTTVRYLRVDVQVPTQVLYESKTTAANLTTTGTINLAYAPDAQENQVSFSVAAGTVVTAVNATITLNGSGMLLQNNTLVNFSGVFSQSNNNVFYVTWKLFKVNASGSTNLCQSGNDNTGGTPIGTSAKKTIAGSCTYVGGENRFFADDNITLIVNMYNGAGLTRTFTHFWEGASNTSWTQFNAYKLGTLAVSFANYTDPLVNESTAFIERCNTTCQDGLCLNTAVYMELWNGSVYRNVSTSGNITLNGTQANPLSLGNYGGFSQQNFSLYGYLYSLNNTLRCVGTSTYSDASANPKNVSVMDRIPPTVVLNAPTNGAVFQPQSIAFTYTPYDLRLANCSLWGNWTGWARNQTNTTPLNNQLNSFAPVYLTYGIYAWNAECYDIAANRAFATNNFTIYIAGDVGIRGGNITFSNTTPVEGQAITIFANVSNFAGKNETSVIVQFWNGVPGIGTQIGTDQSVFLLANGWNVTNISWNAVIGTNHIYVVVDPPNGSGSIVEYDETNNLANNSVTIRMWQQYYGNVTGNLTLGSSDNSTFTFWMLANAGGNIFITDTDTLNGINFASLKALGRDTVGGTSGTTLDDFEELDRAINSTNFTDSVNRTYTLNGAPWQQENLLIYSQTISGVAVVNTSVNFTTGILWDSDDSANSYYDETDDEDVVFVSGIKEDIQGNWSIVDYEMLIPARLKDYRGSTGTVTFYYEIV